MQLQHVKTDAQIHYTLKIFRCFTTWGIPCDFDYNFNYLFSAFYPPAKNAISLTVIVQAYKSNSSR